VVFGSDATTLVPGDTNAVTDVFRHDRRTGTTRRVSLTDAGRQANDWSGLPSAAADGRCVAFLSVASNLVPRDTNNDYDAFTRCVGVGVSFPRGL
jgi:hypothetical protein